MIVSPVGSVPQLFRPLPFFDKLLALVDQKLYSWQEENVGLLFLPFFSLTPKPKSFVFP